MAIIKKGERDEYIIVHHMRGEGDVLDFLHMTPHIILDRLCFEARRHGSSGFSYRNNNYRMTWQKDDTFLVEKVEEADEII